MTQYTPLSQHPNTVLFINPDAPIADLHACAVQRLQAVKNLMTCLDGTRKNDPDETDLASLADVARLLLQDSCDILEAVDSQMTKHRSEQ
ncbi:hypothetical protein ABQX22_11655 [Xanthomonas sp. WHRI 1810A]|uniref:hypothetical protein n=1 Tax=Xanthomonas sp. WHRI 1810A TaxID=3161565 RepID=UPI0032E8AB62